MTKVAVLGASDKEDRYSNKAVKLLLEKGHEVYPIHPKLKTIESLTVYPSLDDLPEPMHTISVYVSPDISTNLKETILNSKVQRVIFNPGSENPDLEASFKEAGIEVLEACTLVLLKTGQF